MPILDQAFQTAATYTKLTSDDITAILQQTAPLAATGQYEPFKTTAIFDSTAQHPGMAGV